MRTVTGAPTVLIGGSTWSAVKSGAVLKWRTLELTIG
jgi:hypothetical protein